MSQTLEQKRAQYAHAFTTKDWKNTEKKWKDADTSKLLTLVRKTPTMIIQNGLGQTLAFLLADAGGEPTKPSQQLYNHMQIWLCEEGRPCRVYAGQGELIKQLMDGSSSDYIRAQQEVLALFNWLKKFADAWLQE